MNKQSGFMSQNDITIKVDKKDYAETVHHVSLASLNLYEYVHGGIYYSLADAAAGLASRSNGSNYVTLNSSFNYMKAVREGTLTACGTVINRTSKICVVQVDVKNEEEEIVSTGTFTMYKVI